MCDSRKLSMSLSFLICQTSMIIYICALVMQVKIQELVCTIQHLVWAFDFTLQQALLPLTFAFPV